MAIGPGFIFNRYIYKFIHQLLIYLFKNLPFCDWHDVVHSTIRCPMTHGILQPCGGRRKSRSRVTDVRFPGHSVDGLQARFRS